jgi:hypothetical protein
MLRIGERQVAPHDPMMGDVEKVERAAQGVPDGKRR